MQSKYLSCAETAKLLRGALKAAFPGVKFSVKSKTYSGGASITVSYVDGPDAKAVEAVAGGYTGADFDGSIDLKCYTTHWLHPDGTTTVEHAQGTTGSMGCIPATLGPQSPPVPGAVKVHFGADFVFVNRDFSPAAEAEWAKKFEAFFGEPFDGNKNYTKGGWNEWGFTLMHRLKSGVYDDAVETAAEFDAAVELDLSPC